MEFGGLIALGVLFAALFLNVPIAFSLGVATYATLIITNVVPMTMPIQKFFTSGDSFPLLAVPFFVLAGEIMARGGISKQLVDFGKSIFGGITGSLGMITVFTCAIFAAISGSGPATVAAIGGIMVPYMKKDGYDPAYAATLAACGGTLGPVIPPSIVMIMYGVVANISITDLFLAGIVPGLLTMVVLMITTYIVSKKYGFGERDSNFVFSIRYIIHSFWKAKWAILMPVIILGGIYSGVFTPTEAAVIACVYGLIISIFVTKELKVNELPQTFVNSALTNGTAVIMVGCAMAFGEMLTMLRIPGVLAAFIQGMTDSKIVVLLMINILLLLVGMFMETLSAVLILAPLLLTIVRPFGVDPIHFGLIMTVNLVIGQITPPVGVNLFIGSRIGNVKVEQMFKWLPLFLGVLITAIMIVTYVPALSLFLIR